MRHPPEHKYAVRDGNRSEPQGTGFVQQGTGFIVDYYSGEWGPDPHLSGITNWHVADQEDIGR
jgi:hypothetical protein